MKKILVPDDRSEVVGLVKVTLESENYQIIDAFDDEEAINSVEIGGFDLVITDLKMPRMDGIELTRAIRRIEPDHFLPLSRKEQMKS